MLGGGICVRRGRWKGKRDRKEMKRKEKKLTLPQRCPELSLPIPLHRQQINQSIYSLAHIPSFLLSLSLSSLSHPTHPYKNKIIPMIAPVGTASDQKCITKLHATISNGTSAASKMKKFHPAAKPKASST